MEALLTERGKGKKAGETAWTSRRPCPSQQSLNMVLLPDSRTIFLFSVFFITDTNEILS
jgi:hypothetical protein